MSNNRSLSTMIRIGFFLIFALSVLSPVTAVFADDGSIPSDGLTAETESTTEEPVVLETPEVTPTPEVGGELHHDDQANTSEEIVAPVVETDVVEEIDLQEIVDLLVSEDLKIEDANGQPLSLASNEAAEVLANSDPFFWNGTNWVGYTVSGTGCRPM